MLVGINIIALVVIFWLQAMIMQSEPDIPAAPVAMPGPPDAITAQQLEALTLIRPMAGNNDDHAAQQSDIIAPDSTDVNVVDSRVSNAISNFKKAVEEAPAAADLSADDPAKNGAVVKSPGAIDGADAICAVRVRHGDTLWKISQRVYGTGFKYLRIYQANPHLVNPAEITTGEMLRVPLYCPDSD